MKRYRVTVKEKATKKTVSDLEEVSTTKKYLIAKYRAFWFHHRPEVVVKITRLTKNPGLQIQLF